MTANPTPKPLTREEAIDDLKAELAPYLELAKNDELSPEEALTAGRLKNAIKALSEPTKQDALLKELREKVESLKHTTTDGKPIESKWCNTNTALDQVLAEIDALTKKQGEATSD